MRNDWETPPTVEVRIPVKLNSDSGICEHHFRKVCGQGFFEQKLSFEGVIPPFFGALKSRGHAACAKRCFGV